MSASIKLLNSLAKVFLDAEPTSAPPALSGFQNERLSFQAAYIGSGERGFARLELDSPIHQFIRARRVLHVPVGLATFPDADANYLRRGPGLFPDLLRDIDQTRLRIFPDQWQSIWIDIDPAGALEPGTYPVALRLLDEDGAPIASAVTSVEILPGMLPPQVLRHTKWLHLDCIANYYQMDVWSERFWAIAERFVRAAVRRGINMILTPIHTPPLDTAVGGERLTNQLVDISLANGAYRFGFERLRRWVAMCEHCGVEYYEMAHLFTQWGARFSPKIMATVDGECRRLFGWDVPAQSDAYRAFLGAYLPALTAELRRLGIAERTYFHISDEPSEDQLDDYRAAVELVSPLLDGFEIIDALSSLEFYRKGVLKRPIPANDHIHPFIEAGVERLWTYYCVGQYKDVSNLFIAQPSARNRIFGAQLYKYDIEGILHWGYNYYNDQYSVAEIDPYAVTDADGFVPGGDPFQVYPGAGGEPEDSIRIMVTHEALQDLRAFRWLEALAGREAVMALVEDGLDQPLRFDRYPRDDEYILTLRQRVNAAILSAAP